MNIDSYTQDEIAGLNAILKPLIHYTVDYDRRSLTQKISMEYCSQDLELSQPYTPELAAEILLHLNDVTSLFRFSPMPVLAAIGILEYPLEELPLYKGIKDKIVLEIIKYRYTISK